MKRLSNNCRLGKITVTPDDWKTCGKKALSKSWQLKFRFYDDNLNQSKQIVVKFNKFDSLEARRVQIEATIKGIAEDYEVNNLNPIADKAASPFLDPENKDLNKYTPFIEALRFVSIGRQCSEDTKDKEERPALNSIERAAKKLDYNDMPIWDISLKHLYQVCESAAVVNKVYSGAKFNRLKKVLRQLYKELLLHEVVPVNYPLSLPRKKEAAKKKKEAFTPEERNRLNAYLLYFSPEMWLYVRIFYHSGARSTELLRVKRKDVDFDRQVITYLVLKGREYSFKERPMLDIAKTFWKQACEGVSPDDYIFGEGLVPGPVQFTKNALKLRWGRVATDLRIDKGLYALKHTHTTALVGKIGIKQAAVVNAESEQMLERHYDLGHEQRMHDQMIAVDTPFV